MLSCWTWNYLSLNYWFVYLFVHETKRDKDIVELIINREDEGRLANKNDASDKQETRENLGDVEFVPEHDWGEDDGDDGVGEDDAESIRNWHHADTGQGRDEGGGGHDSLTYHQYLLSRVSWQENFFPVDTNWTIDESLDDCPHQHQVAHTDAEVVDDEVVGCEHCSRHQGQSNTWIVEIINF